MDGIEARLDKIDGRLERVEARLDTHLTKDEFERARATLLTKDEFERARVADREESSPFRDHRTVF